MIASTQTNHPLAAFAQTSDSNSFLATREVICSHLRSAGLRSTQPRIAIYKVLNDLKDPASIEQIFRAIKATNCDLVTVYRGLALFEELGLVRRTFSNNGTGLYQLKREGAVSYYISCRNTDRRAEIDPQDAKLLNEVLTRIENSLKARGFTQVNHRLEFEGSAPETTQVVADASQN